MLIFPTAFSAVVIPIVGETLPPTVAPGFETIEEELLLSDDEEEDWVETDSTDLMTELKESTQFFFKMSLSK